MKETDTCKHLRKSIALNKGENNGWDITRRCRQTVKHLHQFHVITKTKLRMYCLEDWWLSLMTIAQGFMYLSESLEPMIMVFSTLTVTRVEIVYLPKALISDNYFLSQLQQGFFSPLSLIHPLNLPTYSVYLLWCRWERCVKQLENYKLHNTGETFCCCFFLCLRDGY